MRTLLSGGFYAIFLYISLNNLCNIFLFLVSIIKVTKKLLRKQSRTLVIVGAYSIGEECVFSCFFLGIRGIYVHLLV